MFIVSVTFIKPMDEVNAVMEAHRDYLKKYFEEDKIIGWVSKTEPDNGGFVFYNGKSSDEVEKLVALDPFSTQMVATHDIYAVTANKMKDNLNEWFFL